MTTTTTAAERALLRLVSTNLRYHRQLTEQQQQQQHEIYYLQYSSRSAVGIGEFTTTESGMIYLKVPDLPGFEVSHMIIDHIFFFLPYTLTP